MPSIVSPAPKPRNPYDGAGARTMETECAVADVTRTTLVSDDTRRRHAEIIERYARGETHQMIAEALGISRSLSSAVCRAAGLGRANGVTSRRDPARVDLAAREAERRDRERRVLELCAGGMMRKDVAVLLGVHRVTIEKICRAAGYRRTVGKRSKRA